MAAIELEAEVPAGLQPGDTFQVQTPVGLVPVQVPAGALPGQKVRFNAPQRGAMGGVQQATPVLLGNVSDAYPPVVQGMSGGGYPQTVQGTPYRWDPKTVQAENLVVLQGIPIGRAERKLDEVKKGSELASQWPLFPQMRPYRDVFWILPFLIVVAAVIAAAVYCSRDISTKLDKELKRDIPAVGAVIAAGAFGGGASLVAAILYASLAKAAPGCVVWTSLLFSPSLLVVAGFSLLMVNAVMGLLCILLGMLFLSCVFCCYRPFIPFMIKLVQTVGSVMKLHPMMVMVSCITSVAGLGWSVACGLAFAGGALKYENQISHSSQGARYGLAFVAVLIFVWGHQVAANVAHVTYCGVFGRWYYKAEQQAPLRKSFAVALTTSFGSICFGSFLIAAVRALEAVVRQARQDAQQDGNPCCCIILLALECVVGCIGDILEFFSEWAYVQCAVRGVGFVDAARITYSFMTCSNIQYIIQALLVNTVVSLGALLCGIIGAAVGAGAGAAMGGSELALAGGAIGLFAGFIAGGTAAGIISSGTKTILALWAENPEPLRFTHPEIHMEFESRIIDGLNAC
eukprot:TRINITY_DN48342_c0_g1_i1.p1 TRINITY_DN48342_c0_g1~~TRINITY_DN48342_c0_g1_i1.p1  ORF type:complete len:571 (-),score=120.13 TRINITY_DN48342_c0_g1_i1:353-2065(-)